MLILEKCILDSVVWKSSQGAQAERFLADLRKRGCRYTPKRVSCCNPVISLRHGDDFYFFAYRAVVEM